MEVGTTSVCLTTFADRPELDRFLQPRDANSQSAALRRLRGICRALSAKSRVLRAACACTFASATAPNERMPMTMSQTVNKPKKTPEDGAADSVEETHAPSFVGRFV